MISALGVLWKEWCWSWNSSTLATSCEELTHWKRLWCWEGLGAGGEGDDRGWSGWMASLTRWTWVWVNSGSWWWTGKPGVPDSWGRKESDTCERLNWTELNWTRIKILNIVSNEICHLETLCGYYDMLLPRGVNHIPDSSGSGQLKNPHLLIGHFWTLPDHSLFFADFNLDPFTVVKQLWV